MLKWLESWKNYCKTFFVSLISMNQSPDKKCRDEINLERNVSEHIIISRKKGTAAESVNGSKECCASATVITPKVKHDSKPIIEELHCKTLIERPEVVGSLECSIVTTLPEKTEARTQVNDFYIETLPERQDINASIETFLIKHKVEDPDKEEPVKEDSVQETKECDDIVMICELLQQFSFCDAEANPLESHSLRVSPKKTDLNMWHVPFNIEVTEETKTENESKNTSEEDVESVVEEMLKRTAHENYALCKNGLCSSVNTNLDEASKTISKEIFTETSLQGENITDGPYDKTATSKSIQPTLESDMSEHKGFKSNQYLFPSSHHIVSNMTCLYNQTGKLCTVLDQRCIRSVVQGRTVMVSAALNETSLVNTKGGYEIVWRGTAAFPLSELTDGTDVMYDAMLSSDKKIFQALIIWMKNKPAIVPIPSKDSYVFVSSRGLPCTNLKFDSCIGLSCIGHMNAIFDQKKITATWNSDFFFINGRRVSNPCIYKMFLNKCDALYATVNKLMKGENKGSFEYYSNRVWTGSRPFCNSLTFQRGEIYKKEASGIFTKARTFSCLELDVPGKLKSLGDGYELVVCNYLGNIMSACVSPELFDSTNSEINLSDQLDILVQVHIENDEASKQANVLLLHFPQHNITLIPYQQRITLQKSQNKILRRLIHGKQTLISRASSAIENDRNSIYLKYHQAQKVPENSYSQSSRCDRSDENNILLAASGILFLVRGDFGFLKIYGNFIEGSVGIAAFNLPDAYVNCKPLHRHKNVRQHFDTFYSNVWHCTLEICKCTISGVEVNYIAQLAWQGMKPRVQDRTSLSILSSLMAETQVSYEGPSSPSLEDEGMDLSRLDLYPTTSATDEREIVDILPIHH